MLETKINKEKINPPRINYDFCEFNEPERKRMHSLRLKQKDHEGKGLTLNQNISNLQTPLTINVMNDPNNKSTPIYSPYIPLTTNQNHSENKFFDFEEIIENEVKKRVEEEVRKRVENELNEKFENIRETEKEQQRAYMQKLLEEERSEWERNNKSRELQEKIKSKDVLLGEKNENINILEQKIQMLLKIRELDEENTELKQFIENRVPNYDYYLNDSDVEKENSLNGGLSEEDRKRPSKKNWRRKMK